MCFDIGWVYKNNEIERRVVGLKYANDRINYEKDFKYCAYDDNGIYDIGWMW